MTVLAADFGGTTIKLGLVRDGRMPARDRMPAQADRPMSERLEAVASAFEAMLAANGLALSACNGIGLSLPFLMDATRPRVLGDFGKFPGAANVDFGEWGRKRLALPVAMENDLRAALLGEWSAGIARGNDDVVMLALGTGIGCAAVCGGRLLQGSHRRAASMFGHSSINLDGTAGRCGIPGCAEDLASTATLGALARAQTDFDRSPLREAATIDYETVFRFADAGDSCSRALVAQSLRVWSTVALNAVLTYDPTVLVLGGGVLRRPEIVLSAIREHLEKHLPGPRAEIQVVAGALGDDAALLGCERLVASQLLPSA